MKTVKVSKFLRILKKEGWVKDRQKGSHRQFVHPTNKGPVTINGGDNDDVWEFLLKSIEEQSGLVF